MKKVAILLALIIFAGAGISAVTFMKNEVDVAYNAQEVGTDAYKLWTEDYSQYDTPEKHPDGKAESERNLPENPDGVASIIVTTDLSETHAVNDVAPIVFDYRGYDTMGESFILLTAIAGSYIILKNMKGREEEEDDE